MPKPKARIPSPTLSPHRRQRIHEAIESVREEIRSSYPEIGSDDPQLWFDTLDGETDVLDVARRLGRLYLDYDAFAEAAAEREQALAARKARLRKLAEASKAGVYEILEAAGLMEQGLVDTDFTASFREAQQKVREDVKPEDVPTEYVRVKKEVSKSDLMAAYKAGKPNVAQYITNGGPKILVIGSK